MTHDEYKQLVQNAFDAMPMGKSYRFTRTFTDGDVAMFCGVTGDFNPYHLDDDFAAASPMRRRIIPGLLTASMATHIGGMIGFLATHMNYNFLLPVYVGDTVTCTVTIIEKDAARRRLVGETVCINQEGKEVLRGTFEGFPSLVRLA